MIVVAILCAIAACGALLWLSIIDLKTYILPNPLVAALAFLGFLFHASLGFDVLSLWEITGGALVGFWCLFILRLIANYFYKTDALGLGDVKLFAAAGLWLGIDGVLLAMSIGAICGLCHGIIAGFVQSSHLGRPVKIMTLQIPAGPGFALGIFGVGVYLFHDKIL